MREADGGLWVVKRICAETDVNFPRVAHSWAWMLVHLPYGMVIIGGAGYAAGQIPRIFLVPAPTRGGSWVPMTRHTEAWPLMDTRGAVPEAISSMETLWSQVAGP